MKRGLVLGKFLPPHLGHLYLAEVALGSVDELAIVVGTLRSEAIPGALRHAWMRELVPGALVLHLDDELPSEPRDHPRFWELWEASLRRILPWQPDVVFASDPYGERLAAIWQAEAVILDTRRSVVPASGTAIRAAPLRHWQLLPRCVRPFFVRRVCVFGPESTGKSRLAADLAQHFHTLFVPEYARTHLEARGGTIAFEDLATIARRQLASEEALARSADRLLLCDTDALTTALWSEALFGRVDPGVAELADAGRYDLTLLLDVDVPFVPDSVRYLPTERHVFFERCEAALRARKRRYVVVRGDFAERFETARAAVAPMCSERGSLD